MAYVVNDGALLKQGWKSAKENLGFWILLILALIGIYIGISIISGIFGDSAFGSLIWLVLYIVFEVAVGIGLIRVALQFASGKKATAQDMLNVWDVFLPFLGGMILYMLVMLVGFFLFIIPGVIWMIKFQFVPYLIVDKKMGIMDSFKKSAEMTNGLKWDLLGFYILTQIVNILGFFALLVGMFITVPTTLVAMASLYKKLAK